MAWRFGSAMLLVLPALGPTWAKGPSPFKKMQPPNILSLLGGGSVDALAGSIRGYLVENLPYVLYEAKPGWGQMKYVARGIEWKGQGLDAHPVVQRSHKNHGVWRHVMVTAENVRDTMVFDIRNVQQPTAGRMRFDVFAAFDARVHYQQQNWRKGRKWYDGTADAKFRVKLDVTCEATARLDKKEKALLPDAVFRLRVTRANLSYDNFDMEHVAGLGGEAARVIGDAIKGGLKKWDPDLERELLAKANAAIVKAGDTKNVRLSLSKVMKK